MISWKLVIRPRPLYKLTPAFLQNCNRFCQLILLNLLKNCKPFQNCSNKDKNQNLLNSHRPHTHSRQTTNSNFLFMKVTILSLKRIIKWPKRLNSFKKSDMSLWMKTKVHKNKKLFFKLILISAKKYLLVLETLNNSEILALLFAMVFFSYNFRLNGHEDWCLWVHLFWWV